MTGEYEDYEVWIKRENETKKERERIETEERLAKKAIMQEHYENTRKSGSIVGMVPRDPGVLKDYPPIKLGKGEVSESQLGHLNKQERKDFKRCAWDFCESARTAGRISDECVSTRRPSA